jgi:hypothetical protein
MTCALTNGLNPCDYVIEMTFQHGKQQRPLIGIVLIQRAHLNTGTLGEGNTVSQGCSGRNRSHPALGGLSMLLGVYPVVGIILLIIFLLGVSFQMHAYWKADDAQMKQIDRINFTKNMALVGALLMFLLLPHPWPMSLGIG